mgnify:CR=1 FL=1
MAALLLGYHLENRLKAFTAGVLGRTYPILSDGLKKMEQDRRLPHSRHGLFSDLLGLRNKAIHQPTNVSEAVFKMAVKKLSLLEETAP